MSYDLRILRVAPGADPVAAARMEEPGDDASGTHPLLTWDDVLRERIVAELRRLNPAFEADDHELNDERTGVQIGFFGTEASLTLPYWHGSDTAAGVFRDVWAYLRAMTGPGGAVVYDPQLGRILNLESDRDLVLKTYAFGVGALNKASGRRPWWKFW